MQVRIERVGIQSFKIVNGLSGMTGMESVVKQGVADAGLQPVRVVDGAKAGVQFLAGLARLTT